MVAKKIVMYSCIKSLMLVWNSLESVMPRKGGNPRTERKFRAYHRYWYLQERRESAHIVHFDGKRESASSFLLFLLQHTLYIPHRRTKTIAGTVVRPFIHKTQNIYLKQSVSHSLSVSRVAFQSTKPLFAIFKHTKKTCVSQQYSPLSVHSQLFPQLHQATTTSSISLF